MVVNCKVTEGGSGQGGVSGHAANFLLFSNLLLTRLQPWRAQRWGTCMDLPQLGPVAVLLLKSGKSVACPETPSVTLPSFLLKHGAKHCCLYIPTFCWQTKHHVASPLPPKRHNDVILEKIVWRRPLRVKL